MNLLIWFGFIAVMIAINWFIIKKEKISPLHPLNAAIVILAAWGLECGWPIQNLGTTDFIDRTLKPYEGPVFWFKFILAIGFAGCYYANFIQ